MVKLRKEIENLKKNMDKNLKRKVGKRVRSDIHAEVREPLENRESRAMRNDIDQEIINQ